MSTHKPTPSDDYEPVDSVPDGVKWKAPRGPTGAARTVLLSTPGEFYKLIRDRATGSVTYFKRKDTGPEKSPSESIDAEGLPRKQVRYRVGAYAWFVDTDGLWYCVEVVERDGLRSITIKPTTGWDATHQKAWPYGELLQFPARKNNPLFARLRPLKARAS